MTRTPLTETAAKETLERFQDPETGRSVVSLKQVHQVAVDGNRLVVTLGLTSWAALVWEDTCAELSRQLQERFPGAEIEVELAEHQRRPPQVGETGLRAKSVIGVGSGKGGVGKSSIAALIALGLAKAGCRVGLMDADIYGPSIPHLLGSRDQPEIANEQIQPVEVAGLKVLSMGFLVPADQAAIWRGPMLHGTLNQFLAQTNWGDLDYLVVDMPPGTGDVALSLAQLLPSMLAVAVSTPQDVALLDVGKAITMFRTIKIDVVGMIENMSFFVCPECGTRHDIFGSGGARQKAQQLGIAFLGELPIDTQFRRFGDEGRLPAALEYEGSKAYLDAICRNLAEELVARNRRHPQVPSLPVLG